MRFTPDNFMYMIKQVITGLNGDSVPTVPQGQSSPSTTAQSADGGIKVDVPFPIGAVTNLGGNTSVALTGNMSTLRTVDTSGNQSVGHVGIMIPRDYDEASDHFKIRVSANLVNADAGVTLNGNSTLLFPGSPTGNQTTGTVAQAQLQFATGNLTVGAPLSQTVQILEIDLSGQGLLRDTVIDTLISYGGNATTGNATIYGIQYHYDSTIVSYNDTTTADDIGSNVTGVAGTLTGYGMPLR